jgi:hypothetical protein
MSSVRSVRRVRGPGTTSATSDHEICSRIAKTSGDDSAPGAAAASTASTSVRNRSRNGCAWPGDSSLARIGLWRLLRSRERKSENFCEMLRLKFLVLV